MAVVDIASVADRFPVGTTVEAYAVGDFPPGWQPGSALPAGLVATGSSDVQADGSLSISGLTAGARYRLHAVVGGQTRYVTATAKGGDGGSVDGGLEIVSRSSLGGVTERIQDGVRWLTTRDPSTDDVISDLPA